MSALPAVQLAADTTDYYEVRDLLSGETIGRISGDRVRWDDALRRALKQHGFRLVAPREAAGRSRPVLADAA
jgi:hypothetical protein